MFRQQPFQCLIVIVKHRLQSRKKRVFDTPNALILRLEQLCANLFTILQVILKYVAFYYIFFSNNTNLLANSIKYVYQKWYKELII